MPLIHRLCCCLLAAPAVACAQSSIEGADHFDCLINPAVSGLISCLPPENSDALAFQWDMGDGTVYTSDEGQPHIYHTYSKPGEYTVTLTVNRDESATTSINVLAIPEPREDDASSQIAYF